MARPSKLHLDNGTWRSRIGGKLYYFGPDERAARREFHRLLAKHNAAPVAGRPEYVADAVTAWIRLHDKPAYRRWLDLFIRFAGATHLDDVGRDLLTRFLLHLREHRFARGNESKPTRALAPESIRHYVRAAAAVLRWAHSAGWCSVLPDSPRLPNAVRKARDLTGARVAEILAALPESAGRVLRFIAETGARPGEACGLRWEHVRLDLGVAVLPEHKSADATGRPRTLYLTPGAREVLADVERGEPTAHVFTSRTGEPYTPSGLRSILKRHGGVTPYQLRHTFAQACVDSGVGVDDVAKLLGHATAKTTRFYAEVRDARAVEVASRIRIAGGGFSRTRRVS